MKPLLLVEKAAQRELVDENLRSIYGWTMTKMMIAIILPDIVIAIVHCD